jgi:hypothetical protein
MVAILILSMSDYAIVNHFFVPQQEWINEITSKCGASHLKSAFDQHSLIDLGEVMPIFGAYYGLLL